MLLYNNSILTYRNYGSIIFYRTSDVTIARFQRKLNQMYFHRYYEWVYLLDSFCGIILLTLFKGGHGIFLANGGFTLSVAVRNFNWTLARSTWDVVKFQSDTRSDSRADFNVFSSKKCSGCKGHIQIPIGAVVSGGVRQSKWKHFGQ